jgi:hypothetical protein
MWNKIDIFLRAYDIGLILGWIILAIMNIIETGTFLSITFCIYVFCALGWLTVFIAERRK